MSKKKPYTVTIYHSQDWESMFNVEATNKRQAEKLALDMFINGRNADDTEMKDEYISGTEVESEGEMGVKID